MAARKPTTVRFMNKNGRCNIRQNAEEKRQRYINDIFNTLIDMSWRNNLLFFVSTYIIAWSLFGFLWWVIAAIRGDLSGGGGGGSDYDYDYGGGGNETSLNGTAAAATGAAEESEPCALNVHSYWSAFLFFVETETSVGYGKRAVTDKCPEGVLLFVIQALLGSILDSFMVGCIYIKIAQPKNRAETLVFSDYCTISPRDGKYCLMFRVANLRNSLIVQSRIRAKFVKSRETLEGEFIGLHQDDINVGFDSGADNLFLVTPLIISHEINSKSPFYEMDADYLKNEVFEIIVILEGLQESTGMICQARTSYLSSEVLWGHRFVPVLSYDVSHFRVDHAEFHKTYEVSMPNMSMADFETMEGARLVQNSNSVMSVGSLAVPGKVGNGQHHDKHTIYKRKESVKNHHHHQQHSSSQAISPSVPKHVLPSSNSEPVAATIVTMIDEEKPDGGGGGGGGSPKTVAAEEPEWPDTSLNVSVHDDVDVEAAVPAEKAKTPPPAAAQVVTSVTSGEGVKITSSSSRVSKMAHSQSASNISVASSSAIDNALPSVELVDLHKPVQRALSGGDLATVASAPNSSAVTATAMVPQTLWQSDANAKAHVAIPIPSDPVSSLEF